MENLETISEACLSLKINKIELVKRLEDFELNRKSLLSSVTNLSNISNSNEFLKNLESLKTNLVDLHITPIKIPRKCRFFNRGYCKYQDQCNYHHSPVICQKYLSTGICEEKACSARHPRHCRYWSTKAEGCKRESACQYLHISSKRFIVADTNVKRNEDQNLPDESVVEPASNLAEPVIESSKEKFICNVCDLLCDDEEVLTEHTTAAHENEYHCVICGTSHNWQKELTNHITYMHQNYSCDRCEFVSYGQIMMEDHIATSHVQLSCDVCDFTAKNKGGLTRHKNAKHENFHESQDKSHFEITTTETTQEASFLRINFPINFGPV